jgi:hypothetical protein
VTGSVNVDVHPVAPVGQSKICTQYDPAEAPFGAKSSWPSVAADD